MKNYFVAKKLDFPENFDNPPRIIRAAEFDEIRSTNDFVKKMRQEINEYRIEQESLLKEHQARVLEETEKEGIQKFITSLETFQREQKYYFDLLESHCRQIVKCSLTCLLEEVGDEQRLLATVKAVAKSVQDESSVTLTVNSRYTSLMSPVAKEHQWAFELDDKLASDECEFSVPLGKYKSCFKTSVNTLMEVIG